MNTYQMNLVKTIELIALSKRLWIAARAGTSVKEPHEAEKEFWHHMALLKLNHAEEYARKTGS
jgi:hypothetical protein